MHPEITAVTNIFTSFDSSGDFGVVFWVLWVLGTCVVKSDGSKSSDMVTEGLVGGVVVVFGVDFGVVLRVVLRVRSEVVFGVSWTSLVMAEKSI